MSAHAEDELRNRIERHGPVGFDQLMEIALYHPDHGFYASGGQAGRRGDFLTSPEVGPLFGEVIARALDAWWHDAGDPPVFVVVEVGAGPGTLARAVLRARPACSRALRYVLVETTAVQRAQHTRALVLEDPASAFASITVPDDDEPRVALPGGPIVVSVPNLPKLPGSCVVLANELLDNLPVALAERVGEGWHEIRVGLDGDGFAEVAVPLATKDSAALDRLAPDAAPGARVPLQSAAAVWATEARSLAGPAGRVVAFDYATTTADLASRPQGEWLRTYRSHGHGADPLEALGTQDITCEVAVDQLGITPTSNRSQADWLRDHGLEDLVAEGRRIWEERAHLGDLDAVRARSRVTEADALLDPAGLGAFRVLEWTATPSSRTGRDRSRRDPLAR